MRKASNANDVKREKKEKEKDKKSGFVSGLTSSICVGSESPDLSMLGNFPDSGSNRAPMILKFSKDPILAKTPVSPGLRGQPPLNDTSQHACDGRSTTLHDPLTDPPWLPCPPIRQGS